MRLCDKYVPSGVGNSSEGAYINDFKKGKLNPKIAQNSLKTDHIALFVNASILKSGCNNNQVDSYNIGLLRYDGRR